MTNSRKTIFFGIGHFSLQILLYALGFAAGSEAPAGGVLGISLYQALAVITFPVVYLLEKLQWSGWGMTAWVLNSAVWASAFYGLLRVFHVHRR